MSTPREDREVIQVYVPKKIARAIQRKAEQEGRSVSSYAGRVLRTALRAEGALKEDRRRADFTAVEA